MSKILREKIKEAEDELEACDDRKKKAEDAFNLACKDSYEAAIKLQLAKLALEQAKPLSASSRAFLEKVAEKEKILNRGTREEQTAKRLQQLRFVSVVWKDYGVKVATITDDGRKKLEK